MYKRQTRVTAAQALDGPGAAMSRAVVHDPEDTASAVVGRPVRALHPFSAQDGALLEIINRGEFMIRGIANRDLRERLFPSPAANPAEAKRRPALMSRKLRLLRALPKIKGRNLYQVSEAGRTILTSFPIARQATLTSR
jgi:hypothetical protein